MPKNGNPKNKMVKTSYPIIKVELSSKDYAIHLGPFMPFNSSGFATPIDSASHIIKTNTTIKIAAPRK
jgi:hypothetical protein